VQYYTDLFGLVPFSVKILALLGSYRKYDMGTPIPSLVTNRLANIMLPDIGKNLVDAKVIQEIAVNDTHIAVKLSFPYPIERQIPQLKQSIIEILAKDWPQYHSDVDIRWRVRHHKVQKGLKPKSAIKNIIAVASGKGGVGKSTVAVNLALALKGMGASVALLDADIYGPSQPTMLGKSDQKAFTYNKKLIPVESHGIQTISIGYLVDGADAMIWRGPMVSSALQQLLNDTAWPECDYLIIDLPPGTGDIQLTMAQKIPMAGAVVVTTPQDISLIDAKKACVMLEKVEIPVLGLIENMSGYHCPNCQHYEPIFGENGADQLAQAFNVPVLAHLPLHAQVRAQCDNGVPLVAALPDSPLAQPYWKMAEKVAAMLSLREIDFSAVMPQIVLSE
jgi:ATP-binding protein involved in chromosome partitioning